MTDPLLAAVVANRDDLDAWAVYADALQTAGDPRGALIALMLEHERRPAAAVYRAVQAQLVAHAAKLAPKVIGESVATAWRRGYPSGIHLSAPAGLAALLADPALAFVEEAQLEIAAASWPEWRQALATSPPPWRRVWINIDLPGADDPLPIAQLVAQLPALEDLRIVRWQYGETAIDFADIAAPRLRRIVFDGVGVVTLDGAALPALAELQFVNESAPAGELQGSTLWSRLERVVLDNTQDAALDHDDDDADDDDADDDDAHDDDADDDDAHDDDATPGDEPQVLRLIRTVANDWDEYDPDDDDTAFMILREPIDHALLAEVAAKIDGLEQLAATIAVTRWPLPVWTVIKLRGAGTTQLLPFGIAAALQRDLGSDPPVVLFATTNKRGTCGVVLQREPVHSERRHRAGAVMLRRLLEAAFGVDPGIATSRDVIDMLATTREVAVLGKLGDGLVLLDDVDPAAAVPAPEVDDFDFSEAWEHERDLASDLYPASVIFDDPPDLPPALEREPIGEPEDIEPAEPAELAEPAEDEPEPAPESPDGDDAWLRLGDIWDDRLNDKHDDCNLLYWQDPERCWDDYDVATEPFEPTCLHCEEVRCVRRCTWCGEAHCTDCALEDEDGLVFCKTCCAELDAPPLPAQMNPLGLHLERAGIIA